MTIDQGQDSRQQIMSKAYQHSSLGNVAGLGLLLWYRHALIAYLTLSMPGRSPGRYWVCFTPIKRHTAGLFLSPEGGLSMGMYGYPKTSQVQQTKTAKLSKAYQHSSLGNVTRLGLLLWYRLHVISVCSHGRICCRGVDGHHLDALVLEELQ